MKKPLRNFVLFIIVGSIFLSTHAADTVSPKIAKKIDGFIENINATQKDPQGKFIAIRKKISLYEEKYSSSPEIQTILQYIDERMLEEITKDNSSIFLRLQKNQSDSYKDQSEARINRIKMKQYQNILSQ